MNPWPEPSGIGIGATQAAALLSYFLAYMLVLATPGPNMLLVGGIAALRGFRRAAPLAAGLASGVGLLGCAVFLAAGLLPNGGVWSVLSPLASAALLIFLGLRTCAAKAPDGMARPPAASGGEVGLGLTTALCNPVSCSFFASQFLGPLGDLPPALAALLIAATAGLALCKLLLVAALMARPAIRSVFARRFRLLTRVASALLVGTGIASLKPLLAGWLA